MTFVLFWCSLTSVLLASATQKKPWFWCSEPNQTFPVWLSLDGPVSMRPHSQPTNPHRDRHQWTNNASQCGAQSDKKKERKIKDSLCSLSCCLCFFFFLGLFQLNSMTMSSLRVHGPNKSLFLDCLLNVGKLQNVCSPLTDYHNCSHLGHRCPM